jgi:hypothetical protein
MPISNEVGHYGVEFGEPSVQFHTLPPDVRPERARPSHNVLGQSNDALLAAELASLRNTKLLEDAQHTIFTQFSRYSFSIAGGLVTGTAGGMAGGSAGLALGYIGISAASFVTEKVLGITIPPEVIQFGEQASEVVSVAAASASEWVPSIVSDNMPTEAIEDIYAVAESITQAGKTFYAHLSAGISGISIGGFVAGKTYPYGWNKGDGWGRNLGAKISIPFVKIHDKVKKAPQEFKTNLFDT